MRLSSHALLFYEFSRSETSRRRKKKNGLTNTSTHLALLHKNKKKSPLHDCKCFRIQTGSDDILVHTAINKCFMINIFLISNLILLSAAKQMNSSTLVTLKQNVLRFGYRLLHATWCITLKEKQLIFT